MKKKFAIGSIFLLTYLVFLIATLPAAVVLSQITLPKNINITGVTGSIWDTSIVQVSVDNITIEQVNSKLSVLSLFTLAPSVSATFGNEFTVGPEGQFELTISQDKAKINNAKLFVNANDIAQQLTLAIPMTAQGNVELVLDNVEIDLTKNKQCIAATGTASWVKAGVVAFEQDVKLGKLDANIGCEKGALTVLISPKNDLGLTFTANLTLNGKASGNGFLKPGANFPKALNNVLPFLGKQDNQGRYRLYF